MENGAASSRRPGRQAGLTHLGGGEDTGRQARIAKAHLDFDDAVAPHPRADGERRLAEYELEVGDLQPLGRQGDLAIGGQRRRPKLSPDRLAGLFGGDDEAGRLNSEYV
ncbi:MAG: hypothetical protein ACR2F8_01930 [Caulobacteraceae bacterium]